MLPPPSILGFSRGVAQTEARRVWDAEAGGSSPPTPTVYRSPSKKGDSGSRFESFQGSKETGYCSCGCTI